MPLLDLQVAVISSDLAAGGVADLGCRNPEVGDDGRFQEGPSRTLRGDDPCNGFDQPFLQLDQRDGPACFDDGQICREAAEAVGCVVGGVLDTPGCAVQQPLEAVLKALTPATCEDEPGCTFVGGKGGHGGPTGPHAGFLRDDALLAIVFITDGDDGSAAGPELFRELGQDEGRDPAAACAFASPGALHPVERFVEGLDRLKRYPEEVFIGVIGGLPARFVSLIEGRWDGGWYDEEVLLAEAVAAPELRPEGDGAGGLRPSCTGSGGAAVTPTRLLRAGLDLRRGGPGTAHRGLLPGRLRGGRL